MSAHSSPDIHLENGQVPLSDPQLRHERELSDDHKSLEQVISLSRVTGSIFSSTLAP